MSEVDAAPSRRAFVGASTAALLSAGAAGCSFAGVHIARFRLSVRVSVDGREYEGSSVNQIRWRPSSAVGPVHTEPYRPKYWAEAPILDLGTRGLLFALLQPPYNSNIERAFNIFRPHAYLLQRLTHEQQPIPDWGRRYELLNALQGEFELRPQELPALLRFGDLSDPATAELVEHEAFERVYGNGARFLGGALAITREPITTRIEHVLPWLSGVRAQSGANLVGSGGYEAAPVATRLIREHLQVKGIEP